MSVTVPTGTRGDRRAALDIALEKGDGVVWKSDPWP